MKLLFPLGLIWAARTVAGAQPSVTLTKSDTDPLLWNVGSKVGVKSDKGAYRNLKAQEGSSNKGLNGNPCLGKKWVEDCQEGSKIFRTHGHISQVGCNQNCASNKDCKSFAYDDETKNCALLKVSGGTTKTHVISGPDFELVEPRPIVRSMARSRKQYDCSEFSFAGCDQERAEQYGNDTMDFRFKREGYQCEMDCKRLQQGAKCLAFLHDKGKNLGTKTCWLSAFKPNGIISTFCDLLRGRAKQNKGPDAPPDDPDDPFAYDKCLFDEDSAKNCMRGYCDSSYLGAELESDGDTSINEKDCKTICSNYMTPDPTKICTHYEYNKRTQECKLFQRDPKEKPPLDCTAVAAKKGISVEEIKKCIKPDSPDPDIHEIIKHMESFKADLEHSYEELLRLSEGHETEDSKNKIEKSLKGITKKMIDLNKDFETFNNKWSSESRKVTSKELETCMDFANSYNVMIEKMHTNVMMKIADDDDLVNVSNHLIDEANRFNDIFDEFLQSPIQRILGKDAWTKKKFDKIKNSV